MVQNLLFVASHRRSGIGFRLLSFLFVTLFFVGGCSQPEKTPLVVPFTTVTIGVVGAIQPMGTSDLLAGYIPENRELASAQAVTEFNTMVLQTLKTMSNPARHFTPVSSGAGVNPSTERRAGHNSALAHWIEVGRKAGVELLLVPQILTWHEREGSAAGVVSSAELATNFFLIDVTEGLLLSRSHYAEKQEGLTNNLLKMGDFFKRGGKWVPTLTLAQEATEKMVKEFGL